ncbi:hypothetical protein MKX01_024162 [Papaver californicum]|nr:hypothetical protein MKX01_024162 [Papaver californicum]
MGQRCIPVQTSSQMGFLGSFICQGQIVSNSLATAIVVPGSSTTTATTPALAPIVGKVALPPCNWMEQTSP